MHDGWDDDDEDEEDEDEDEEDEDEDEVGLPNLLVSCATTHTS